MTQWIFNQWMTYIISNDLNVFMFISTLFIAVIYLTPSKKTDGYLSSINVVIAKTFLIVILHFIVFKIVTSPLIFNENTFANYINTNQKYANILKEKCLPEYLNSNIEFKEFMTKCAEDHGKSIQFQNNEKEKEIRNNIQKLIK